MSNSNQPAPSADAKRVCPACHWVGEPEKYETRNGIRGPGSRVISREWSCPNCGTKFTTDAGWSLASQSKVTAPSADDGTPETDAFVSRLLHAQWPLEQRVCVGDFARSLERRLSAALAERDARAKDVSTEEANELQDVLKTIASTGRAFITSARELTALYEKSRAELAKVKAELIEWKAQYKLTNL